MITSWTRHKVSELIANSKLVIGDGYRAKNSELSDHGLPFARAGNIVGGFNFTAADRFPEASLSKVRNKISAPGDVVFTSKGTVGRFAFVRPDTPQFVYSPQLCFWRSNDHNLIDPRFLFYWMQGREFYIQFKGVSSQTDMAEYVSLGDQRRMHITLPSLPNQQAIAHILGTLDDKLELNRQMNKTLDELARALFTSWFVNFDPVRAKAEGRQPESMDAETAALFPDRFVDSEIGPIPEVWKAGRFTSLASIFGGGTPKTDVKSFWNGNVPWFAMADLPKDGSPFVIETGKQITTEGESRSSAKQLPKYSTVLTARGTVGETVLAGQDMAFNQSCYGLRPASDAAMGSYTLFLLTRSQVDTLRNRAHGSVFATITRSTLDSLIIPVPAKPVFTAFEKLVAPLFELMLANSRESGIIADLRDTLLPELLSGQVEAPMAAELTGIV